MSLAGQLRRLPVPVTSRYVVNVVVIRQHWVPSRSCVNWMLVFFPLRQRYSLKRHVAWKYVILCVLKRISWTYRFPDSFTIFLRILNMLAHNFPSSVWFTNFRFICTIRICEGLTSIQHFHTEMFTKRSISLFSQVKQSHKTVLVSMVNNLNLF